MNRIEFFEKVWRRRFIPIWNRGIIPIFYIVLAGLCAHFLMEIFVENGYERKLTYVLIGIFIIYTIMNFLGPFVTQKIEFLIYKIPPNFKKIIKRLEKPLDYIFTVLYLFLTWYAWKQKEYPALILITIGFIKLIRDHIVDKKSNKLFKN